jgi:hypothetical protein
LALGTVACNFAAGHPLSLSNLFTILSVKLIAHSLIYLIDPNQRGSVAGSLVIG